MDSTNAQIYQISNVLYQYHIHIISIVISMGGQCQSVGEDNIIMILPTLVRSGGFNYLSGCLTTIQSILPSIFV